MILLFLLESLGYMFLDRMKHLQQDFSFWGGTQTLLHIVQRVKANAKRGLKLLSD
jgi:hypothetical protein